MDFLGDLHRFLRSGRFADQKVDQRRRTRRLSKRHARLTSLGALCTGSCNDVAGTAIIETKRGEALDQSPINQTGKPSVLSVVQLVLSLCALVATSVAAILWNPIDTEFITRADNAGWDETMLLPHEMELSLVVNASVLATFVLVVTALCGVPASRRRPGVGAPLQLVDFTPDGKAPGNQQAQRQAQWNGDAHRIDGE
jgi:hypothetical protein